MPFRPTLFAATLAALGPGAAQAYTLHVLHINDFHSRIESINAFEFDVLGGGRGGRGVLRWRRPAPDRDQRAPRRAHRRRRERRGAERGRRLPGVAVLHRVHRAGRGGDAEPHRVRCDGLRQPRVRPRAGAAGEVHRDGRVSGDLGQRRRLRRQSAGAARRRPPRPRHRWRAGRDPRRDDARHRRDRLARPDCELPRPGRVPDRQGGGARRRRASKRSSCSATLASSTTSGWSRRCPGSTRWSAATPTRCSRTSTRTLPSSTR